MKIKTNTHTEMNANTHTENLTTIPAPSQETNPLYERILLGIDQHAADRRATMPGTWRRPRLGDCLFALSTVRPASGSDISSN